MSLARKHRRKAAQLAFLCAAAVLAARADTKSSPNAAETRKLCYCGCDAKPGSAMCLHMCDLAKYKGRWWTRFCDKTPVTYPPLPTRKPPGSVQRRNGPQSARR